MYKLGYKLRKLFHSVATVKLRKEQAAHYLSPKVLLQRSAWTMHFVCWEIFAHYLYLHNSLLYPVLLLHLESNLRISSPNITISSSWLYHGSKFFALGLTQRGCCGEKYAEQYHVTSFSGASSSSHIVSHKSSWLCWRRHPSATQEWW